MGRKSRWRLATAATLTAGTVLLSALGLAGLRDVRGPIGFGDTHDRRAYTLLVADASPATLAEAAAEASAALRLSPYNNTARMRLAYIDTVRRGGALGPKGMAQLQASYDLVPLDHTVAAWRVRFGLEYWPALSPDLRKAVQAEAMAFGRHSDDVDNAMSSVRNPEGRLAAALWSSQLARQSRQR